MTEVAFIILNYKTYSDTIRLVKELYSEDLLSNNRIIVVDNASPNESFSVLKNELSSLKGVDVIQSNNNGGYAKGNNIGLRYAERYEPTYVCIINNDVHFSKDTIIKLQNIYPHLDRPAIISPIQKLPDGTIPSFAELTVPNLLYDIRMNTVLCSPKRQTYYSNTSFPNVQQVGYIPGAFLFASYDVFKKIGFFYEGTFLFGEERFTGKLVELAGLHNYIIIDEYYIHEHSKTIKNEASESRKRQLIHEGRKMYYKKFSKCPVISVCILNISYAFHEIELFIFKLLKK